MSTPEDDGFESQRDAVDSLEQEALDGTTAGPEDPDRAEREGDSPAFELDLDPEDQGSAGAAAANPD